MCTTPPTRRVHCAANYTSEHPVGGEPQRRTQPALGSSSSASVNPLAPHPGVTAVADQNSTCELAHPRTVTSRWIDQWWGSLLMAGRQGTRAAVCRRAVGEAGGDGVSQRVTLRDRQGLALPGRCRGLRGSLLRFSVGCAARQRPSRRSPGALASPRERVLLKVDPEALKQLLLQQSEVERSRWFVNPSLARWRGLRGSGVRRERR